MAEEPQNPTYPKTPPLKTASDDNRNNNNFYTPPWNEGFTNEEVISTNSSITVAKEVNGQNETFRLGFNPYIIPTASLSLEGYAGAQLKGNPVLLGETIDELRFTWVINKEIQTQTITNDGGVLEPTLVFTDRTVTQTGLSLTSDVLFTLTVNDGDGVSTSIITDQESIIFGNYFYYGDQVNLIGQAIGGLQSLINNLGKDIARDRIKSFYPTGGTGRFVIIAYPARFGLATTIFKAPFAGGFVRLKNVSNVLVETVPNGQTEIDISLSNGIQSESYYIYQSSFDNQEDPNNLIIVS